MVNRISSAVPNEVTRFQMRWKSFQAFAEGAGVRYKTAQLWRHRNSIPGRYHYAIAQDACRLGIGETAEVLAELAKMKSRVTAPQHFGGAAS